VVDEAQQGFIGATQTEPLLFEIRASADGDYIDGLEIILEPEPDSIIEEKTISPGLQQPEKLPDTKPQEVQKELVPEIEIEKAPTQIKIETEEQVDDSPIPYNEFEDKPWVVQVGAFGNFIGASKHSKIVSRFTENPIRIIEENSLHKVQVLGFSTITQARQFARVLKNNGIESYVFRVKN
jgi:cell division protein FtsN